MRIHHQAGSMILDTMLTFLAFIGSLYIHMGSALWKMPSEIVLKYSLVLALLFLGLGLWTSIPFIKQIHGKTLAVLGFFVAAVHVIYWPCTLLMGRVYALPTLALITNCLVLFTLITGWRALMQLSQPLVRAHISKPKRR